MGVPHALVRVIDSDADTDISGNQPRHWTGSLREQMTEEPSLTCILNQCRARGV